jgi:hypothetical protein
MPRLAAERPLIRPLAGLLALVLAGAAAALPIRDERPLQPGQSFALRVDAGAVEVAAGEAGKVRVEADVAPGQRLVWREAADRHVLIVDDRERLTPRPATLRLFVPPEVDLVLRLGDASLRLAGVGGQRLRVEGGRGDVRVDSPAGSARIETGDGDIDAALPAGSLTSRSVGGRQRLAVAGAPGRLDAASAGGAIEARLAAGGPVRLASVTGALAVSAGSSAELDAHLDTLSGRIELRLPAGQPMALELAQARGDLDLPAVFTAGADGRLRFGEGGGRARLASFGGAISVRFGPAPASGGPAEGEPPAGAAPVQP